LAVAPGRDSSTALALQLQVELLEDDREQSDAKDIAKRKWKELAPFHPKTAPFPRRGSTSG
jgi:hypothetical protein